MNNSVKIFKCFIASPSDTKLERDVCDKVVYEINKSLGEHFNFRVETKRWENDVRPNFGIDGQDVINSQIAEKFDIFIGIMWKRLGAKTARAESGTVEEFNIAYSKHKNGEDVTIMFYFNNAPLNFNDDELEITKVKAFRKRVSDLGGLYHEYDSIEKFSEKLKAHLEKYFLELFKENVNNDEIPIISKEKIEKFSFRSKSLNLRLKNALKTFSSQPIVWVEPILTKENDITQNPDENFDKRVKISEILSNPTSSIIKAPPQFGLTCLAHHLTKEAWDVNESLWIYIDTNNIKSHSVIKALRKELETLDAEESEIKCLILDSWMSYEKDSIRLLKNVTDKYPDIPVMVMQTIDDSKFQKESHDDIELNREFQTLNLLALSRSHIRKVVSSYNEVKKIGDDDIILNKLISDMDVLNIHRTPYNCLTLLKVSEKYFDESPVNRTKMLEMVLFLLFNIDDVPTYKIKPDLKDCEYVLGRFCENMLKKNIYSFSREAFIKDLSDFCREKLIDLEVELVFDILFKNNIITKRQNDFIFRSSYWIYYFAAHRMQSNKEFANYIFEEQKYISYPEIIEFYTGIDRNREDALEILLHDLQETHAVVQQKVGLPENMNPFKTALWKPSEENIAKMQSEINNDVQSSNLPTEVKDRYADTSYNQLLPYNQSVQNILHEYSLVVLMKKIKATSAALRNSDYVSPELKRTVITEITKSMEQVSKVLLALSPLLASKGRANFEGAAFMLNGDFGNTYEERINTVIQVIPTNIIGFFKSELYSGKMGPLLYDQLKNEKNEFIKHLLAMLITMERPRGWKKQIECYIDEVSKNSFYLYDIFNLLRAQYTYSFASPLQLNELKDLIKISIAKHEFGTKKAAAIKRIPDDVIPERSLEED